MTIDNLEPKLSEADDGSWTTELGFTNLTDGELTLVVAAAEPKPGCKPTLDKPALKPASHATVKLTLPAGCNADEERVAFTVAAQAPATERFAVSAKADEDKPKPDWNHLLVFPVALFLAFGGVYLTYRSWTPPEPLTSTDDGPPGKEPAKATNGDATGPGDLRQVASTRNDPSGGRSKPTTTATQGTAVEKPKWNGPLKHLDSTYDFKESLVSNITAVGAVLTGIFGSAGVVEAALGEDAKAEIGLATVGAAIALALIAAGTVVPLAAKARDAKSYTVIGILLGASVTLAGAAGQLWVVTWTGIGLDLGVLADVLLWISFALALLLLISYGRTALVATLNQGMTAPKEEPSDAVEAAQLIAEVLRTKSDIDERAVDDALARRYPRYGTSPGDEPFPRRRAATL